MTEIQRLTNASAAAARELGELGSVLHADERVVSEAELALITSDPNVVLMVVKDGETIVGMATLYILQKIGKRSGILEDVIVDEKYRGQGLGEKLMRSLIDEAKKERVSTIALTSRSHRVAAHKLYEKLGFSIQETNVFRLKL